MKRFQTSLLFLFLCALILSVSLFSGCGYNRIQTMDEEIDNKWAQVENQLQRRSDLIPNLVKVTQSYAKFERDVYSDIADARARMSGAIRTGDPERVEAAEGEFSGALSRLLAIAENYPQLKADRQYIRLTDELAGTENRIAVARMDYNNAVRDYNAYIRQFPVVVTAKVIGSDRREYYNPPESTQQAPRVEME